MHLRAGAITVVWKNSNHIQTKSALKAASNPDRILIEERGRQVGEPGKAGKEVGGEKKAQALTEISGVATSMSGKMNRPQSVPDVEVITVVNESVRCECAK
ncbi:MAG: hypothetical protein RLZZ214_1270 [Verrucomicrobiota bacterium]|jgi:hypothetical protein